MNKPAEPIFATRPTITLELPLAKNTRILRPDQVMLKIGSKRYDLGALCYALSPVPFNQLLAVDAGRGLAGGTHRGKEILSRLR